MTDPDLQTIIDAYLLDIKELYRRKDTTEHSYRPALQQLIQHLLPGYIAINERKRVEVGAPDFVIFKRDEDPEQLKLVEDIPLGFVEAKDIIPGLLDRADSQAQVKRYMELGNVVHTDGLEFRFYFGKEHVKTLSIARIVDDSHIIETPDGYEDLAYYLTQTVTHSGQTIRTAKSLALLMADRARPIRRTIFAALQQDIASETRTILTDQYNAFRETLIHTLSPKDFADIYAETIAYGLFAARYNDTTPDSFSLREAAEKVPQTNPFLRQFFLQIAAYEKDERLDWVLNNFAVLFRHANVHTIMANYGKTTGMNHDPVTHFYETFLGEYDSKRRKARGVYYTPLPVVQHIVRAVDTILIEEFGLADGLADDSTISHTSNVDPYKKGKGTGKQYYTKTEEIPRVQILDPATGTGTFLNETIKLIAQRKQHLGTSWSSYVEANLLPRLHGFELLMAAYSMAHMRLSLTLADSGYVPSRAHPRVGVYLTNTLEEPAKEEPPILAMLGMSRAITEEAISADKIKRDLPIMIVMGNPPYSVSSSNKSKYIDGIMADYKKELNERNIQPLSDDYIKFIRYSEQLIEKTGSGVVAMITNNSYIDGLIHRQMRRHLLDTFDSIRIVDLHGSTKKKETSPDGSADENVFDIQQGVSIVLLVKTGKKKPGSLATVQFSELYGKRQAKYDLLDTQLPSVALAPHAPSYYFIQKSIELQKEYDAGVTINELFDKSSSGITTSNDKKFVHLSRPNEYTGRLVTYSYKPFDSRHLDYSNQLGRARKGFTELFDLPNYAIAIMRRPVDSKTVPVFVSQSMIDKNFFGFQSYAFPIYTFDLDGAPVSNINQASLAVLLQNVGQYELIETTSSDSSISSLDILDYVYGVLHDSKYADKYSEQLVSDFPRIPAPKDRSEYDRYRSFGTTLRELHLLHAVAPFSAPLTGEGDGTVERWVPVEGNIYINSTQYFPNIPEVAWDFSIGGIQPAQKWLKDRKGAQLSYKDVEYYQKIIAALLETHRLIQEF